MDCQQVDEERKSGQNRAAATRLYHVVVLRIPAKEMQGLKMLAFYKMVQRHRDVFFDDSTLSDCPPVRPAGFEFSCSVKALNNFIRICTVCKHEKYIAHGNMNSF